MRWFALRKEEKAKRRSILSDGPNCRRTLLLTNEKTGAEMSLFFHTSSCYADLYYFEVGVYSMIPSGGMLCYGKRMDIKKTGIFDWKNYSESARRFDWQLYSTNTLLEIVRRAYEEELKPFIENDLIQMGKQPFVWKECICKRTICQSCWVEKNCWEAREAEASAE